MADRDLESGRTIATVKKLYGLLFRSEVISAAYILVLCAAFVLETRGHRNLFYALALPVFLLNLRRLDLRLLRQSDIAKFAFAYLAYFLLSALWSDGLAWPAMADLLRVSLLASLFFVITALVATRSQTFEEQLFFWFALTGGISLLAVFAALMLDALPGYPRLVGFGRTSHPIIGATLYGSVVLISAFYLLPRASEIGQRLLWLGVIGLGIAFLLQAGSRGPLLAFLIALVVAWAVASRRTAIAAACLLALGLLIGVVSEFKPIELLYLRAPSGHFQLWPQALEAIAERPWFGHGSLVEIAFTGKQGEQRSPHNLLLANQLYGGIPAILLLSALLLTATLKAYKAAREGAPIYLVLLVFGFVASLFDSRSLVQNLGREWITFWLPFGLLAAREMRDRKRRAAPHLPENLASH